MEILLEFFGGVWSAGRDRDDLCIYIQFIEWGRAVC